MVFCARRQLHHLKLLPRKQQLHPQRKTLQLHPLRHHPHASRRRIEGWVSVYHYRLALGRCVCGDRRSPKAGETAPVGLFELPVLRDPEREGGDIAEGTTVGLYVVAGARLGFRCIRGIECIKSSAVWGLGHWRVRNVQLSSLAR